jgi:hypothetical protein
MTRRSSLVIGRRSAEGPRPAMVVVLMMSPRFLAGGFPPCLALCRRTDTEPYATLRRNPDEVLT